MAHRKIDVDAFDQDRFVEDEELYKEQLKADKTASSKTVPKHTNVVLEAPKPDAEIEKFVDACAREVSSLLSRGDCKAALAKALQSPPQGIGPQSAKDKHAKSVIDALSAFKTTEIINYVRESSVEDLDLIMKYVYRGMASPELFNSALLLQWHEKLYDFGGLGSIVRVMTDRKRV